MKLITLDYYCARLALPEGEKQWRFKTKTSAERLVYQLTNDYPGVPARFFVQSYTKDENGAPLTLTKEETIQVYNDYPLEPDPTPRQVVGAARRAEW
jgi:hypothetical protein